MRCIMTTCMLKQGVAANHLRANDFHMLCLPLLSKPLCIVMIKKSSADRAPLKAVFAVFDHRRLLQPPGMPPRYHAMPCLTPLQVLFWCTGHAPMTDLWCDKDLGRLLLHFHQTQKPTASMCHGPVALLATKVAQPDVPWAYSGYKLTCYSNTEEKTNELLFGDKLQFKVGWFTLDTSQQPLCPPQLLPTFDECG